MSITDSRPELDDATAKVAAASDEQLQSDLSYWAIATADHWDEFMELAKRRDAIAQVHRECQAWVGIIVTELQARRARSRAS